MTRMAEPVILTALILLTGITYGLGPTELHWDSGTGLGPPSNMAPAHNRQYAVRFNEPGTLISARAHLYVWSMATSNQAVYEIRADSRGEPGRLLGQSGNVSVDREREWRSVELDSIEVSGPFWVVVRWIVPDAVMSSVSIDDDERAAPGGYQKMKDTGYANPHWTDVTINPDHDLMVRATIIPPGTGMEESLPTRLEIESVRPSVIHDRAVVSYSVSRPGRVELNVYDATGRLVRTLVDGVVQAGTQTAIWDRTDDKGELVADGIYFYRLSADGRTSSARAVVLN